tara:strand:+ start:91 stop:1971 length:1881 start_codon:yes stop_codon:yes gene_type:complete
MALINYNISVNELDENSETIYQPIAVKIKLKPHQLTLLKTCINFENHRIKLKNYNNIKNIYPELQDNDYIKSCIGIIGDKVGSGKSYVILSLILYNKEINSSQIESFGLNKIFINISKQIDTYKTNLLIVPHNLYYQWLKYIKNVTDSTDFIYKTICRKKDLQEFINDAKKLNDYDLILVTDTNFKNISNIININNIKINRVIFDEIDSLNIPNNKNISCKFYWFITASYGNLLYPRGYFYYNDGLNICIRHATGLSNKGYIKDLFNNIYTFMNKEFSSILVLKNNDTYVDKSFEIPDPIQFIIKCKEPIFTKLLNGIVDKNIINCLNANNNKGAIALFNSKQKITEENIINIVIEKFISEINNLDIQINAISQMQFNNDETRNLEERKNRIDKLNDKKQIINDKINNIKSRINNNNLCNICYDEIKNDDKSLVKCCSNIFCFKCINLWLSQKADCPLCKESLSINDLFLIQDKNNINNYENIILDENNTNENFDKLKNLEILMKNKKKGSKYLIFSEYDITFDNIIIILNNNNIKYSYLKGNKYIIEKLLRDYKYGDLDILLVNINNYGSGLNLENTTDIIMFHNFDASIEKQVIGRAQRFGRKKSLNIYYLLNNNEITNMENES